MSCSQQCYEFPSRAIVSSSSSWREDSWGPLRRLSMMTVILCLLPLPSDTKWWSIANLHDPRVTRTGGRPGALRQTASGWYPDLTAITCFRIWCAGVVAPNLATCPNSMWRLHDPRVTSDAGYNIVSAHSVRPSIAYSQQCIDRLVKHTRKCVNWR